VDSGGEDCLVVGALQKCQKHKEIWEVNLLAETKNKDCSDTGSRTRVCPVKADRDSRYTISDLLKKTVFTYLQRQQKISRDTKSSRSLMIICCLSLSIILKFACHSITFF
jgi:hypothetical protein